MKDTLPGSNLYSDAYKKWVLILLTGMYTINFVDRSLITILAVPIKKELHLSDTQLGLLTGFSFAFFYVIMGIPIARFVDRSNRRNIVVFSLILWSIFTILSGTARSFIFLLLMRIGVGIGEAGATPAATSMLSDYYPPKKRATALSIYTSGMYIGIAIGLLGGGWLNQVFGWKTAFFMVGLPGIIYAIILFLTVKEPSKGYSEETKLTVNKNISFIEGWKLLIRKKTFFFLSIACALSAFVSYSMSAWLPAFYSRIYGMRTGKPTYILNIISTIYIV